MLVDKLGEIVEGIRFIKTESEKCAGAFERRKTTGLKNWD
jgi:hypothetical protein